ncbi:DoxX family protein [Aquihabitans sp. McL0605]|uniref:DoxX family protein n=1 Tax=Aquihabitans sp. McL0605 TaxID=3415671 RepID=UPI003CEB98F6
MIIRRIARPLLSSIFIAGGIDAVRRPSAKVKAAEPVIDLVSDAAAPVAQKVAVAAGRTADAAASAVDATIEASPFDGSEPVVERVSSAAHQTSDAVHQVAAGRGLPFEDETYVRANGAVQVGAGLLLAFGRVPRVASAVLAATLVPTTFAGHRFWELEGDARRAQQLQFAKNLSLLGGLILAAVDTGGAPDLAWRARHARHDAHRDAVVAAGAAKAGAAVAGRGAAVAGHAVADTASDLVPVVQAALEYARELAGELSPKIQAAADRASDRAADLGPKIQAAAERASDLAVELTPKVQAAVDHASEFASERAAELTPKAQALGQRVADALPAGS